MLSYQHIYHAGNLADVHKHAALAWMLKYMTAKPKPISYLESHAGRAVYDLDAPEAKRTGEAMQGIDQTLSWFSQDHPYAQAVAAARAVAGSTAYPGSPAIARHLLRSTDSLHLAELHPQENAALSENMGRAAKVYQQDGLTLMRSLSPPMPRRGLMLIDPSYEQADEYLWMPRLLGDVHRKWNVGVVALWYPILTHGAQAAMVQSLRRALPEGLSHEVSFPPARPGHRMIGSGLFVLNPPYGLTNELNALGRRFAAL